MLMESLSKERFWQHGRHEDEKQNCDWLQMLYLFPVNVRVVKNVSCSLWIKDKLKTQCSKLSKNLYLIIKRRLKKIFLQNQNLL